MRRNILALMAFFAVSGVSAQKINWQNLDLKKDGLLGISADRAYAELLKDKKPVKVIVAVIDSGIDTAHEELKPVLWTDTKTGSHGRNYMGYEKGREDIARLAMNKKDFYDSLSFTAVPEIDRAGYQASREMISEYEGHVNNLQGLIDQLEKSKKGLAQILNQIGKANPSLPELVQYQPADVYEKNLLRIIKNLMPVYPDFAGLKFHEIDNLLDLGYYHLKHGLNIVDEEAGDKKALNDTSDVSNSALGLIFMPNTTPVHGTHVAGIIGAVRNNGKGLDGVADHVEIMPVKVISNIRELRDENLAAGIRFAVDHGAKVINLSFGKSYTWNKQAVDEAVKYAMEKDVLIVHAAGNEGKNIDDISHYPIPVYLNGEEAKAWISVGASGYKDDSSLLAGFSNYGKKSVDVFAPGVQIYSTVPYGAYQAFDGTSAAAPVVAGLAALIREYYPRLTAVQVKEIIMRSVVKRDVLKDKCVSGGVVNAYNALKLAEIYK